MTELIRSNDSNIILPDTEKDIKSSEIIGPREFDLPDLEVVETWDSMSSEEKIAYEKKLIRKLDLRLIPWLTLLYLISFLDRTNIGNANIQGVQSHTKMHVRD